MNYILYFKQSSSFFTSGDLSKFLTLFTFFTILTQRVYSQKHEYKLSGYLYETTTKSPIANATVSVSKGNSVLSKSNGYFDFNLPSGTYQLTIAHLSYQTFQTNVDLTRNLEIPIYLTLKSSMMAEVEVSATRHKNLEQTVAPNVQILSKKDLSKVPSFMGQQDAVKALQTLPGTGKGGEGNSGFYVRGGTAGQNLTLFNDAVIYNPSHLLGFFSIFNSSMVDEVKLYKSGIPAEFGGRLSSIIEVNSSKEISDSLAIETDLSFLSASAKVELPITKAWSVTAAARKTLLNYTVWPLLNKITSTTSAFNNLNYDFRDLNFNSNARIGKNSYLNFSAYNGGDDFGFFLNRIQINNSMDWQNSAYSLTWKKVIKKHIVWNNTASYSGYRFSFGMKQDGYQAGITSRIKDYNFKSILNIAWKRHNIKTGLQYTDHRYTPNTPFFSSSSTNYDFGLPNVYYTDESSLFVSDEYRISDNTGIYIGSRLTNYRHKGPYQVINDDKSELNYGRNSIISSFVYLEPSITFRQALTQNSSIKLAFSKNVQPTHLISITAVNFPADFWMPSLNTLTPEKGYQFSAGYFRNVASGYEAYVDLYYKDMKGLVEFSGGIMNLIDNLKIEDNLLYGSGNAYGSEFFVKKKTGRLTGWIGYTLSKSNRTFALVNNSVSYPAKFDRRHDLSIISNYAYNHKWNFSTSFTYATGNAFTKPTSRYLIGGNIVNEYGSFNGSRMPAYHRMDIAVNYKLKPHAHYQSELSFSIYNVYNKHNPIYIYFLAEGDLEKQRISIQPKSVTLLPILPAVNYRLIFK